LVETHQNNLLVAFSDPGGAKPLLAYCDIEEGANCRVIAEKEYDFFYWFKSKVEIVDEDKLESILDSMMPKRVITGTSYPSSFEKKLILLSQKRQIPCSTYIDHHSNFSKRLYYDKKMLVPDELWVLDENGKKIAEENGQKSTTIIIKGNPYFKWLEKWNPVVSKNTFLSSLLLDSYKPDKKIIVFAPDPLSSNNGIDTFGFDELTVLDELSEIMSNDKSFDRDFIFLLNPHPRQNMEKLNQVLRGNKLIHVMPRSIDVNSLMYFSDLVIGFFSTFLKEAEYLGAEVIRYLPVLPENDPFISNKVIDVVNKNNLIPYLKSIF